MNVYVLEEIEIYVEHFYWIYDVRIHRSTLIVLFQTNTDRSLLHEYRFQNYLEKNLSPIPLMNLGLLNIQRGTLGQVQFQSLFLASYWQKKYQINMISSLGHD